MSNRSFSFLNRAQSSVLISPWRRSRVLRLIGLEIEGKPIVREGCFFGSKRIQISKGCFVNHQCYFDGDEWIRLGERVHVAPRVTFLTASHVIGGAECRAGVDVAKPITIESGCWIGASVTVLPGVRIAQGCVIAAGSIVTRDTDPHGVYAGVPASRIRDIPQAAS